MIARRKPLARKSPLRSSRKRITNRSTKTAGRDAEYSWLRQVWLPGRRCWQCGSFATDIHHRRSRGVAPGNVLDVWNWAALCRPCHQRITEHPSEGYASGLSLRSHEPLHRHPEMIDLDFCRRCSKPIFWARWSGAEQSVPLDADLLTSEPLDTEDGTVQETYREVVLDGPSVVVVALVDETDYDPELPLLRPHRMTCTTAP